MLSQETARQIAARTMQILPYNINVMRADGSIIASGDPARIGTIHPAAAAVWEKQRALELTRTEAAQWEGSREGINLPAYLRGKPAAVIGITGPPEDVRPYGELVVMTSEMMMEQAKLLEEMQVDQRMREELGLRLLEGDRQKETAAMAERMNVSLDERRVVLSLPVNETEEAARSIRPMLTKEELLCSKEGKLFVLAVCREADWRKEILHRFTGIQAGVGTCTAKAEELPVSAQRAEQTSRLTSTEPQLVFFEENDLEVLLTMMQQEAGWSMKLALSAELMETLQVYVQAGGSREAAEQLHIHRNTLQYRLRQIEEVTGKDPRRKRDLLYLYAALVMQERMP
ncbi:CdaR family transcriptional regulator [Alkalicoccus chagannorensis]|uniref:CdaR family transcriptional regulator n=1 Tax=Alkalicoccus chagannorensis TaxID=427072 RepID=UPI0003FD0ECB|nr:sugar diacid recognition domain-containing protein [Alkalicoccus chagannorensis]